MSDTKALITVARSLLAKPKYFCGRDVMADLVAALEQAEASAEKDEKELAGADAEISELRDELEDSRGTEKDAPNILCAIARLVGVYEHCQELGDDMGEMTLDAVRDLLAEKQKPSALRWTNEPPKVAGKYWWRPSGKKIGRIRDMFVRNGEVGFLDRNNRFIKDIDDGEWAGPIAPPID